MLLYQMLFTTSPFRGEDEDEIFDAILCDEPVYPIYAPQDVVSIVGKVFHEIVLFDCELLTRDPEKRLGSGTADALEVMAHSYFSNIDFNDIYHQRHPPPFIPILHSPTDTSNFGDEAVNEVPSLTPVHSGSGSTEWF